MSDLVNVLGKDLITKKTKKCPFIEGAEVTFYDDVPGGFTEQLEAKSKDVGDTEAGYWFAVETIADWNFSGTDGKKLDVTVENLKKLSMKVQRWIFDNSQDALLTDKERKKE